MIGVQGCLLRNKTDRKSRNDIDPASDGILTVGAADGGLGLFWFGKHRESPVYSGDEPVNRNECRAPSFTQHSQCAAHHSSRDVAAHDGLENKSV